jgi:hypothetical protein
LGDDHALRGLRIKFAFKWIAARREWANVHRGFAFSCNQFFPVQAMAIKLFRSRILIINQEFYFFPGGDADLSGLKAVIPDDQRLDIVFGKCG